MYYDMISRAMTSLRGQKLCIDSCYKIVFRFLCRIIFYDFWGAMLMNSSAHVF